VRYHVEVHDSHREQRCEPPSASLIERDPEVIPDVDIAAHVGKDLSLDEKIPRHESGQGCVRVVEHSVLWKEKESLQSVHIPRTDDMHGSRQELDDNEQCVQPRTK
jgi:hypothetical protein